MEKGVTKEPDEGLAVKRDIVSLVDLICSEYHYEKHNPRELSPLTLAFIGDTIFDLIVRTKVIMAANAPVNKLHKRSSAVVNATAQAVIMNNILDKLTDEENSIYRRGKNAKSYTTAKNASTKDYHTATGFEALLGWLYLTGRMERVFELVLPQIRDEHTDM